MYYIPMDCIRAELPYWSFLVKYYNSMFTNKANYANYFELGYKSAMK